jgi:very-short-patch-repair endonuclease
MSSSNFRKHLRRNLTDAERKLWGALRDRQLQGHKFRRQVSLASYVVDFVCLEKQVVVEVDGGQHMDNARDEERTAVLEKQGFLVLRFWNNEVLKNLDGVLQVLAEHLEKR